MRVKASSSFMSISTSGPMMSCTSPPEQKLPPFGSEDHDVDVVGIDERAERVAQLGVALERQRVLALRPVQPDRGDLAVDVPQEVLRLEGQPSLSFASLPVAARRLCSMPLRRLGVARR